MVEMTKNSFVEELSSLRIYPTTGLPLPYGIEEKENEVLFLDPTVGEGKRIIFDKKSTISELFSLLRQFVSPVCSNITIIIDQMLKRGVNPNDFDACTGMTMLHYAIRAAAISEKSGMSAVKKLLRNGANPTIRSLYSHMNALHFAAYFDIPGAADLLLKDNESWTPVVVDSMCQCFDFGSSLHICATALSYKTAEVLLQYGASNMFKDNEGKTPEERIPTDLTNETEIKTAKLIKDLLKKFLDSPRSVSMSKSCNFKIGSVVTFMVDRVRESGTPSEIMSGTLKYIGSIPSTSVPWAGIELETPDGKNDGSIGSQRFFQCKKDHGIFIPLSKLIQIKPRPKDERKKMKERKQKKMINCKFKVGDKVLVAGSKSGVVKFVGPTKFASGLWCGVELNDEGPARNDGCVAGVRYFTCSVLKGVFAPPSKLSLCDDSTDSSEMHMTSDPDMVTGHRRSHSVESFHVEVDHLGAKSAPSTPASRRKSRNKEKKVYLQPGLKVNIKESPSLATVRFVGETSFSNGIWVGIELKDPTGRNDGSVKGKRYFTCPPNHGVMIRPSRISYKGVSGELLLPK